MRERPDAVTGAAHAYRSPRALAYFSGGNKMYADNRDDGLPWFFEPLHDSTDFWDKQAHNNRTIFKMRTKVSILLSSIPRVSVAVLHGLMIFLEFIKIILCHKTHNSLHIIAHNRRLIILNIVRIVNAVGWLSELLYVVFDIIFIYTSETVEGGKFKTKPQVLYILCFYISHFQSSMEWSSFSKVFVPITEGFYSLFYLLLTLIDAFFYTNNNVLMVLVNVNDKNDFFLI